MSTDSKYLDFKFSIFEVYSENLDLLHIHWTRLPVKDNVKQNKALVYALINALQTICTTFKPETPYYLKNGVSSCIDICDCIFLLY